MFYRRFLYPCLSYSNFWEWLGFLTLVNLFSLFEMKLELENRTRISTQSLRMNLVKQYFMPQNLICKQLLYGSHRLVKVCYIHFLSLSKIILIDRLIEVV